MENRRGLTLNCGRNVVNSNSIQTIIQHRITQRNNTQHNT